MHASYVTRNTSTGIVRDTKRFHMPQHFQICISMTILFSPNSTYKTGYSVLVFEGKWTESLGVLPCLGRNGMSSSMMHTLSQTLTHSMLLMPKLPHAIKMNTS